MSHDADVGLLGTGIAVLVAAARLIAEGKTVLLLNPEWDFLGEGSELPLDPFHGLDRAKGTRSRLARSATARVLSVLSPDYPGAIETWSTNAPVAQGFRDPFAPYVRERARLWIHEEPSRVSTEANPEFWDWESLEALYLQASEAGYHPQLLEGLAAIRKFPGIDRKFPEFPETFKGVWVPRLCDVDLVRYSSGLLEFVRERLGSERVLCGASQVELIPDGVRFHWKGAVRTAKLSDGFLCFWTPRLTSWILSQCKSAEVEPRLPQGIRFWEEWSLGSRESLDPSVVGVFEDWTVWADVEGAPRTDERFHRLKALRPGSLTNVASFFSGNRPSSEASQESFKALSRLCLEFLKWDYFTVRLLKTRPLLDWAGEPPMPWRLGHELSRNFVVGGCDGPVTQVVERARAACELFLGEAQ